MYRRAVRQPNDYSRCNNLDIRLLLNQNSKPQIKYCLGENNPVSEQLKENRVKYV